MARYDWLAGDGYLETRRARPRGRWALPLAVATVLFPVLYEGGVLTFARWNAMLGRHVAANTPVLDWISETYRTAGDDLRYQFSGMMHSGQWSPIMAVPVVIAVALLGCLFLRGK